MAKVQYKCQSLVIKSVLKSVMIAEGFRSHVYKCPAGHDTIGYGLNLTAGITRKEAEAVTQIRLQQISTCLTQTFSYFITLPAPIQEVLLDMAYNMGLPALFGFKKMWAALAIQDYLITSLEILDSKYHRDFVYLANGDIESTRSFKNAEAVRRLTHVES